MTGKTLTAMLDRSAAESPEVAARFWSESETIIYRELAERARSMAGGLLREGVRRGEPVGVLCPNAPEFLVGLFAVLYAGGAAAPLPLPLSGGGRQAASYPGRLRAVAQASGMSRILLSHRFGGLAGDLADGLPGITVLATDTLGSEPDGLPAATAQGGLPEVTAPDGLPEVTAQDAAIVQFTSGSTAAPKGVRLTHGNVVAGLAAISEGIALGPGDGGGFWLPLFHDMGLFGTLSAVLSGIPAHVWSPLSFVRNPARWLGEFAGSGATITAMPNFGYDHLLAAVTPEEAADFDLRHWRIAFNGAEPISQESVTAFVERFAPAGLRPETVFGVYGMAEATLAVTFPPLGREPLFEWVDRDTLSGTGRAVPAEPGAQGSRAVAGVGRPVSGLRLRVADPMTGQEREEGVVGEILIQGDPVTSGYLTAEPGADADAFIDGWLRTGDLGYLRGAELFVTGRRKEMITVRGANFYPQDVEAAARDTPGLFRGRCVAAAAPDGSQSMLLIAETTLTGADAEALTTALRTRIGAELGLSEVSVHLVAPRSIPRTSSGKVQRLAARELLVS
ncbi:fatty acyl-AMP ligase [Nonomuraea sp. NPDC050404]|uniref:fatty acyl-AMP ligase n=1 Tax=Nonomuraea sp. NPDC050404 TaxID=3155783 RepID=UPI0033D94985